MEILFFIVLFIFVILISAILNIQEKQLSIICRWIEKIEKRIYKLDKK